MATIVEALKSITAYPIPTTAIATIVEARGLVGSDEFTAAQTPKGYQLAKADVYMWLAGAPDISQGGQSFSFSQEQREQFRTMANSLFAEYGEKRKTIYGYKGSRL